MDHSSKALSNGIKLAVIINVVETPFELSCCLESLRRTYKNIPVVVISDGVSYSKYSLICQSYSVRYVKGERFKHSKHGGKWWLRTLMHASSTEADFVLKIDPDTKFQHMVQSYPLFDISGTLVCKGTPKEHIQGGIQAFSRRSIEALLKSRFFEDSALVDPQSYTWDDNLLRHATVDGYMCSDAMLRKAKIALGLSWGDWSEVNSQWKELVPNYQRYAISHPHKFTRPSHGRLA